MNNLGKSFKIFLALTFIAHNLWAQPSQKSIKRVIAEVNDLRESGCVCGGQWMPPVGRVSWDTGLYSVSNKYARYMAKYDHFDHISREGEDLGDRLDKAGHKWITIGENLAHGYDDFYQVMDAWKESPSHCKMLMHPEMNKMGLSKHRRYWAQSFTGVPKGIVSK